MKYVNIYGKKRDVGKKAVRTIRLSGKVPCILYGKNINIPFFTSLEYLRNIIYTVKVYGVILNIEGYDQNINAIRKEIQFDPVSDKILHVDFYKIDKSKPIILEIPIKSFGRPIGVTKGGVYYSTIRKLKIKAKPDEMPEYIQLNIDSLDIGDRITVENLYNNQYTILHPSHTLIANVKHSRAVKDIQEEQEEKDKEEKDKEEKDKKEEKRSK
ncbi:50S ribosomal protein L25 [Blattabacterium cuenoti]|uniref:50S ribosomal protein L25 n=1 Tax=Blattabacterium cuenoti TaxID=1653831 RepID=UPI00163BB858|nr:50S ribosomal protein L25 [Blattabacterium cuenoti]